MYILLVQVGVYSLGGPIVGRLVKELGTRNKTFLMHKVFKLPIILYQYHKYFFLNDLCNLY